VLVITGRRGQFFSARREAGATIWEITAVCPATSGFIKTVTFRNLLKESATERRVALVSSNEIELFVKYSGQPTPRSVKKVPIFLSQSTKAVCLGTSKTKHARVSNIEKPYLDVLLRLL